MRARLRLPGKQARTGLAGLKIAGKIEEGDDKSLKRRTDCGSNLICSAESRQPKGHLCFLWGSFLPQA